MRGTSDPYVTDRRSAVRVSSSREFLGGAACLAGCRRCGGDPSHWGTVSGLLSLGTGCCTTGNGTGREAGATLTPAWPAAGARRSGAAAPLETDVDVDVGCTRVGAGSGTGGCASTREKSGGRGVTYSGLLEMFVFGSPLANGGLTHIWAVGPVAVGSKSFPADASSRNGLAGTGSGGSVGLYSCGIGSASPGGRVGPHG